MSIDISVVQEEWGLVWHRADCPDVDKARKAGKPLLSMFGCTHDAVDGYIGSGGSLKIVRHSCLEAAPRR
jgi:hypothetical protein